jgi:hypothetical protein
LEALDAAEDGDDDNDQQGDGDSDPNANASGELYDSVWQEQELESGGGGGGGGSGGGGAASRGSGSHQQQQQRERHTVGSRHNDDDVSWVSLPGSPLGIVAAAPRAAVTTHPPQRHTHTHQRHSHIHQPNLQAPQEGHGHSLNHHLPSSEAGVRPTPLHTTTTTSAATGPPAPASAVRMQGSWEASVHRAQADVATDDLAHGGGGGSDDHPALAAFKAGTLGWAFSGGGFFFP